MAESPGKRPRGRPVKAVPPGARRLTPPQAARLEQVSREQIVAWIRSGELPAIDLAPAGARRPRYRIAIEDLEAFEARRAVVPSVRPARKPRGNHEATRYY